MMTAEPNRIGDEKAMAEVEVRILGRAFTLACGEGQEESVRTLARKVEERVQQAASGRSVAVDARVMLMAAILLLGLSGRAFLGV